ncbi:hypothetical protein EIK77_000182 [Talaromyces pinophilus]|nr:hypothetical protein EIK77_000182 [Talaromyces pinophilus]
MDADGDQANSLSWRETKPGIYERGLDYMESLHHQVGSIFASVGGEQWCVSLCIRISSSGICNEGELIQKVQSSWTYMRTRHPEVASIVENERRIYRALSAVDAPDQDWTKQWIDDTFFVIPKGSADDQFSSLPPEAISNFSVGDDLKNLSSSIEIAAQLPATTDEDMHKANKFLAQGAVDGSSIGLNATNLDQQPGRTQKLNFIFTTEEMTEVIKAVKKRGCTVTQAVQTALLLASKVIGTKERDFYSSIAVFDLRSSIMSASEGNENLHRRVAAYHTIWPVNIEVGSFNTTLQRFKEFYTSFPGRQPETAKTGLYRPIVDAVKAALSAPPASSNTSIGLSALGIIDDLMTWQVGDLRVTNFWISQDILTPNVICTSWTRSGRMQINASYNDRYYLEKDVQTFLAMMKNVLFHGLGIRCDSSLDQMI